MNTQTILFALAGALCTTLTPTAQAEILDYSPVKINQTTSATYPQSLVTVGIRSGAASIAVAVDEKGMMTDYLVTAYSHPAFAESAVAALRKWTFEPMRIHGTPSSSKTDLTFNFEVDGVVVVSMNALDSPELIWFKIAPNSLAYRACTPAQLSRAPSPTKVVRPHYPADLARSSRGGRVFVDFYIDEQGHVRMPSVSREAYETSGVLASIAVSTLSQWEFEPPVANGRNVLVRAQQAFDFKPGEPEAPLL